MTLHMMVDHGLSKVVQHLLMVLVQAVRKVKTHNAHACFHQGLQHMVASQDVAA